MTTKTSPPFPLATALRAGLRGYTAATFKNDLAAGFVVSLVALPLSMALAIAVGLPPRHGLYTAIVAGIVAALFGGSSTQVSGPTAAFVVIVAPIVSRYGLDGLIWCQIMAGGILMLMGMLRVGKLINYVPYPVVTGFTAGIAVTIAMLSLNDFLGLGLGTLSGSFVTKTLLIAERLDDLRWADALVGAVTLAGLVFLPRLSGKIPAPAVAIPLGALAAWVLTQYGFDIDTLNTRFSYIADNGATLPGIDPRPPALHLPGGMALPVPDADTLRLLFKSALVVAALAALESLLSASAADSMARTHHDPNAELNGIGLANIFSGLAAGIPATGAIARTATNIHAGARTPVAAIVHSLLILLYVLTLAPYISYTPMAALAALLLMTAWRMSHIKQFLVILRLAPRSDVVALLVTFALTVVIDMVAGVCVGMLIAALLFMRRIAELTHIRITTPQTPTLPDDSFPGGLPEGVMVYQIEGPLFFGTIAKTLEAAVAIPADVRRLVIDLTHVPMIDMTGMMGMKTFIHSVATSGREIVICGSPAVTDRIHRKLAEDPHSPAVEKAATLMKALHP